MRNMNVRDPGRTVVSSSHPKPLDIMSEFKSLYQKENDVASNLKTHEKTIAALKAEFPEFSETIIFRYLQGVKFDSKVTAEKLASCKKWKADIKFAELAEKTRSLTSKEFPHADKVKRFYFERDLYAKDKEGNWMTVFSPGRIDPAALLANPTVEELSEFTKYNVAKKITLFNEDTDNCGYLIKGIRIVDCKGLGMQHVSRDLIKVLGAIVAPAQANFPGYLHKVLIINAPSVITFLTPLLSAFLDARDMERMEILGADYMPKLLEHFDIDQIPAEFGGKNPEPVFDDLELKHEQIVIGAGKTLNKEFNVAEAQVVKYDFRSLDKDFSYRIEFQTGGSKTEIKSTSKAEARKVVSGSFAASAAGTFRIVFDNSSSMFTSKTLIVLIETN